ncbi:MAG: putative 3-hydroxyacyl-CoA dehydrogenase [Flavobacteriaceae bacterium]|nr:MAG: putative 3-hydroxyacyl-CoA dehydrogenase [Flavobacteriaceae bacterium]
MKRNIEKVAVLGSGIMGSGIAAHLAGIGLQVLLLDISPKELNEDEKSKGLNLDHPSVQKRIVNDSLSKSLKSKPSPIYNASFASRIKTGTFEHDLHRIAEVDWIIEVVVERLDIKKQVFESVEKHRKLGTLISSNTSGIPIHLMAEGRSEDFQQHFLGTHFFNPARYLRLLELIPGPKTNQETIRFFEHFGRKFLGKSVVVAKDTPAFIGNRIGIFSIQSLFHRVKDLEMTIEEVDKLTGPVIGRPKSATFRTVDVVGLDTLVHVANGIKEHCTSDERHELFSLPDFIESMMAANRLGSKTGEGFYKKIKKEGKSEILSLELTTGEYRKSKKAKFATLEKTKSVSNVADRFPIFVDGSDKAGDFYRLVFADLFAYVSHRMGEITDAIYKIDDAMKAGFGWEHGPFEIWDAVGLQKGIELVKKQNLQLPDWIEELASNQTSFYKVVEGKTHYYDTQSKSYQNIPGREGFILLDNLREKQTVYANKDFSLIDLGEGIVCAEFHSKMNTIGADVLTGLNKAIDIAEEGFDGLVVGNQGANFSVGANLGMIFMLAVEQEYEELNAAIAYFQNTMMRMRYSSIPVISAPHGMCLGGGCELSLHADKVVASAETYIGLVEFGVGVIPGGGGTKEMTLRASDAFKKNDVELNILREHFLTIAMAKVSTSGHEAYDLGLFEKSKDVIVTNRDEQLSLAKSYARVLADAGYVRPIERTDIKVLGKQALGMFMVGTDSMKAGNYISEYDLLMADKLAYVMSGGDLSAATTVSERYLLDIEREAFLSLCGQRKTLERIQHMLTTGKPLRN